MLTVDPAVAPVGWISILFFDGCAVVAEKQFVDTRPRIVIDDRGIFDRTPGLGVLEWTDIEDALTARPEHAVFIGLELREKASYITRLTPLMQRLVQLKPAVGLHRPQCEPERRRCRSPAGLRAHPEGASCGFAAATRQLTR